MIVLRYLGTVNFSIIYTSEWFVVNYDQEKIDSKALSEAINAATGYEISNNKVEAKKSGSFFQRFFGSS